MRAQEWSRRSILKGIPAALVAAHAAPALAEGVKWSAGTDAPKLKAPPNATYDL